MTTNRTITKADLVESVHTKVGFSKKESSEVVERVFETMKATLESGDGLKISGFGKFDVRRKNARRGRNPKTEQGLIIPERTVVTFKASQVLKAAVAGDALTSTSTNDDDDGNGDDGDDGDEDLEGTVVPLRGSGT
jgi:integration host factor subunit alpha